YPPLTPALERVAMALFGISLRWLRLFSVIAQALVVVLTGMIAAELGGGAFAQMLAALAVAATPLFMFEATEFQYTSFDVLWMAALLYSLARLLRRDDEKRWLALGAFAGLGLMTKYTMAFYLVALCLALLLTPARRWFRSRWLWYGLALAFLLALPNLIWQARHAWISLDFLRHIHARDISDGRAQSFWPDQFNINGPILAAPLWLAGVVWLFLPAQRRFRALGFVFAFVVLILALSHGRGYYAAAVYPLALAAGAVCWVRAMQRMPKPWLQIAAAATLALILANGVLAARVVLPLGQVSAANYALRKNGDLREEVGWNELTRTTAGIWNRLPAAERAHAAIVTDNYGETGAIDILGARYGLPQAISPVNSAWYRGYGSPPPQTEIVLGTSLAGASRAFHGCRLAGHDGNRYGLHNEESDFHPDIFVCGPLRQPWPAAWKTAQSNSFG
ncbi:MAG TPA: glycosyltransferase family 39 protein, partial [Terriglobales bacterium]|nr:glycosyltransferase family 39 protein [Terriglobales bacterium]